MYILALETTGAHASVAVINEEGCVAEKRSEGVLNHLQYLMPMVKELLEDEKLSLDDVTAIAASQGPGSFTGIRIGVSSVRALAQILGKETIAVPTLEAFAYNVPQYTGLICPILDARRSQIYGGAYRWNNGVIEEVIPGAPYEIDDFVSQIKEEDVLFFGDGTKPYGESISKWQIAPEENRFQAASSVARMALNLYKEGKCLPFEELKPNYMRKAEAERKLEEKSK